MRKMILAVLFLSASAAQAQTQAQTLAGAPLVQALRGGGEVLLMRHARSPFQPPDAAAAEPDNPGPERQLDDVGKATARAMGDALKTLRLPIGQVLSSPTYRARQTARLAQLPAPKTFPELGDGGQSMKAAGEVQGAWLRARVAEAPAPGTDTLIITHLPNIAAAFPAEAAGLADGEALVFRPGGAAGPALVGRVRIEDWPALAGKP